jgi:hypothetical protein
MMLMYQPGAMTAQETARYIAMSETSFHRKRPVLEKMGFPKPDPRLNRYVRARVDAWLQENPETLDAVHAQEEEEYV